MQYFSFINYIHYIIFLQQQICQNRMDRQIPVINRLIDRKMQELRTKKHRQTLSQIRNKSNNTFHSTLYQQAPQLNRYSSSFIENKNLQIERQNIKLFNKIASIIREKPKLQLSSNFYLQRSENSSSKHKKKLQKIRAENQFMVKRISQQKSTINNKQLFKDRIKNVKYLKFIGRYPYENQKKNKQQASTQRVVTEPQIATQIIVYEAVSDDFEVKIIKVSANYYAFQIYTQHRKQPFQYMMKKMDFESQYRKHGFNYDQIISRLRLQENNQVTYNYEEKDDQDVDSSIASKNA